MKTLAVVNGTDLKPYALEPLFGAMSAFERVLRYACSLPGIEKILVLAGPSGVPPHAGLPVACETVTVEPPFSAEALFRTLAGRAAGFEHLFYVFADTPFLDAELSRRMFDNHLTYNAEYSFADGYPVGLAPEIVRTDVLSALETLARGVSEPVSRGTVFSIVQKDINAFDIETEISPVDQRLLRLTLACDTNSNTELVRRLFAAGGTDAGSVTRLAADRPELLRTYPAFASVQISGGCPQVCGYCPFPSFGGDILRNREFMPVERFARILDELQAFSAEAVVSVSLWGEPSLHPEFPALAREVARRPGLSFLVETSGIGWSRETLEAVRAAGIGSIEWIVSLDALDRTMYGTLRGEGYDEATATASILEELFPGRVHLQAVRMNENEEHLEAFYRTLTGEGRKVIIQKYDRFCGALPNRNVTDLSPLTRFPCWHLKRDIAILLDGTVPLCREDFSRRHVLGNIFEEPLPEIWKRGEIHYKEHIDENYPELCSHCDEYYTFNF
jgi:spiro-SPASM protein